MHQICIHNNLRKNLNVSKIKLQTVQVFLKLSEGIKAVSKGADSYDFGVRRNNKRHSLSYSFRVTYTYNFSVV